MIATGARPSPDIKGCAVPWTQRRAALENEKRALSRKEPDARNQASGHGIGTATGGFERGVLASGLARPFAYSSDYYMIIKGVCVTDGSLGRSTGTRWATSRSSP